MRSLKALHITSTLFLCSASLSSCGESPAFSVRSYTGSGSADAAAQYADDGFAVPGVNDSRFRLRTFSLTSELESRLVYDRARVVRVIDSQDGKLTLHIPTQPENLAARGNLPDLPSSSLAFAPPTADAPAPAAESDVAVTLHWPLPIVLPSDDEANSSELLLHAKANGAPNKHSEKTKKHTEKQKAKVKKMLTKRTPTQIRPPTRLRKDRQTPRAAARVTMPFQTDAALRVLIRQVGLTRPFLNLQKNARPRI